MTRELTIQGFETLKDISVRGNLMARSGLEPWEAYMPAMNFIHEAIFEQFKDHPLYDQIVQMATDWQVESEKETAAQLLDRINAL